MARGEVGEGRRVWVWVWVWLPSRGLAGGRKEGRPQAGAFGCLFVYLNVVNRTLTGSALVCLLGYNRMLLVWNRWLVDVLVCCALRRRGPKSGWLAGDVSEALRQGWRGWSRRVDQTSSACNTVESLTSGHHPSVWVCCLRTQNLPSKSNPLPRAELACWSLDHLPPTFPSPRHPTLALCREALELPARDIEARRRPQPAPPARRSTSAHSRPLTLHHQPPCSSRRRPPNPTPTSNSSWELNAAAAKRRLQHVQKQL